MPWREGHDSLLPAIDDAPVGTDCGAGYEHSRIVAHVHQNESRAFGVLALGYVRVRGGPGTLDNRISGIAA